MHNSKKNMVKILVYFRELDLFKNNEVIVSHVQRLDFETNKGLLFLLEMKIN